MFEKFASKGEAQQEEDVGIFEEEKEDKEGAGPSTGAHTSKAGFVAINGWFHQFENWFQLKRLSLHGEITSADTK